MPWFQKKGAYPGLVAFDGNDFYAVKIRRDGVHELNKKIRLISVDGEFHHAPKGHPSHNDLHGTGVIHEMVPGSTEGH